MSHGMFDKFDRIKHTVISYEPGDQKVKPGLSIALSSKFSKKHGYTVQVGHRLDGNLDLTQFIRRIKGAF